MMEEPDITVDTEKADKPVKKSSKLKVILILIIILAVAVGAGVFYLSSVYDEEFLVTTCENEISKATGGECKIEHIEWSLLGRARVEGVSVAFKSAANAQQPEFLQVGSLEVNIDYMQSLINMQPVVRLDLDGVDLKIIRTLTADNSPAAQPEPVAIQEVSLDDANVDKTASVDKFSTNIHNLLASVAELPWKEWIADFDYWKVADVDAVIHNVSVNVHDQSELLGDMNYALNMTARLQKTGMKLDVGVIQQTPDVEQGEVSLGINVVFDWDAAAKRADKPLAFIGSTNIGLKINNLDIGYLGKYYIQSDEQVVRLAEPLSGYFTIDAKDLSSVNFKSKLSSKKIIQLVQDNKIVSGGEPGLEFSLQAEADLSQEWSSIKDGRIGLVCSNAQTGSKILQLDTDISGSFGDQISIGMQSNLDAGEVSRSALGRAFDFYNIAQGQLELGSELIWKKEADWVYELSLRSRNLGVKNGNDSIPAPVTLLLSGKVKPVEQFTPELTEFQMECNAPGIMISTGDKGGVTIPLDSEEFTLAGEGKAQIDVPEVFKAFAAPLNKLGLKPIAEILTLDFKVDNPGKINVQLALKNTREQYAPCLINLDMTPDSSGNFKGSFDLTAEKKAVQVRATVEGTKKPDGALDIDFNKQFAMRIGAGINLIKRIQNMIPGLNVAQYPVAGIMRGSSRGRALVRGEDISLAASSTILLEKMSFITDSGSKFTDEKTQFDVSFSLKDLLGSQLLNLNNFRMTGDAADISCKADSVALKAFSESPLAGLEGIKGLKVGVKIDEKGFKNISALLGSSVPAFVQSGKSFNLDVASRDDGAIALQRLEANCTGLAAAITDLVLNPSKLIPALAGSDYSAVIKGLSPFKINIKAEKDFWKGIALPSGLDFSGNAELAMAFEPAKDRLTLSKLIIAGDQANKAFVSRMSAALVLDNVSRLVENPALPLLLESLPNGINVPVVTVSIPRLAEYMKSNGQELPLTGKNLEINRLRLVKAKQKNTLQLAGNIVSSGLNAANMLNYNGTVSLNNLITLNEDSFALTGELNMDNAALKLKALPYVYDKPAAQQAKLYYKLSGNNAEKYTLARAGISGGPLSFDMSNLSYEMLKNDRFKLSLAQFKMVSPLTLTVSGVALNPETDQVRAQIAVAKTDLARLSSSLETGLPTAISGHIGAIRIAVADKYSTILGNSNQVVSKDNKLQVEPSSVILTSLNNKSVSMTVGVGQIQGSTADGKASVGGISITSPTGFSEPTPLKTGQIEAVLDLPAMASGRNIITEVIVSSFKAVYELKLPNNNIAALQKNIDILLPASSGTQASGGQGGAAVSAGKSPTADNSGSSGGDSGVLIKNLYLNNGAVAIKSPMLNTTVSIPQTHVKDIGGDNPRVAFTSVLNVLLRSIGQASLSILDNTAGTAVKSVTNILGNALNNNSKAGNEGNNSNSGEDTVKSVTNLLGNVLGNDNSSGSQQGSSEKSSNPLESLFK